MSGSDGKPCRPRGSSRLAVRSGDDVDHHRDEAEVEDPGQHERDEPRLALELPGVQHGADPGDEAGDDTAGCGDDAEGRDAQERPRQCAALDCRDVVAVHDEDVIRDGERDGEDRDDGASPACDEDADEEPGDCGLEHGGGPFLICVLWLTLGSCEVGTGIYTVIATFPCTCPRTSWRPASSRFL